MNKLIIKSYFVNSSSNAVITTKCPECNHEETMSLSKLCNLPKWYKCYCCENLLDTTGILTDLSKAKGISEGTIHE